MSIVQVIVVCSSPKSKTQTKPEPVQTVIKLCPKAFRYGQVLLYTPFSIIHWYPENICSHDNQMKTFLTMQGWF